MNLDNALIMQGPNNETRAIRINGPSKGNSRVHIWIPREERRLESQLGPCPALSFKSPINLMFFFRIWRSSSAWPEVLI